MTVIDPPTSACDLPAGNPRRSSNPRPSRKPLPDVVDLFIMNALESPPTSPPSPAGGNDLLDALVQAHLQRATTEPEHATPPTVEPAADAALPTHDHLTGETTLVPELLQREINALLGVPEAAAAPAPVLTAPVTDPLAEAVTELPASSPEAAPAPLAAADELSLDELKTLLIDTPPAPLTAASNAVIEQPEASAPVPEAAFSNPTPIASPPAMEGISNEELAALMTDLTGGPTPVSDSPAPAPEPEPAYADHEVAAFSDAEKALAAELAELLNEPAAPPATIPSATPAVAVTTTTEIETQSLTTEPPAAQSALPADSLSDASQIDLPAADMLAPAFDLPPCVVVELPEEDPDADTLPAVPLHRQVLSVFNDLGLLLAQLLDIPFAWIDLLDKNLLGLAAAILLLSGAVLKLLAWRFMH